MSILENLISAFSSVFANKMRSILTMLGIIIGISAVIMITSIGAGVQASTNEQFDKMGMSVIILQNNWNETINSQDQLKLEDEKILRLDSNVKNVVPAYDGGSCKFTLKNPKESDKITILGTTKDYMFAQPMEILYGRFIAEIDVINKSNVIVIDKSAAMKKFGKENVVGQKISIEGWSGSQEYEIIGVCKGTDYGMFYDAPSAGYVPITTLMSFYGQDNIHAFYITVYDKDLANDSVNNMAKLMDTTKGTKDKYNFQNLMNNMDQINNVMGMLSTFTTFVAAISLFVGGIGVMNIMLVSVTERTREIGIRKSLGATNNNIMMQFLIEAVILTLIGGIIGIILGLIGGLLIGFAIDITPSVSVIVIIITVIVSTAIGILAGVYPAGKAAKLDPIEALRYE